MNSVFKQLIVHLFKVKFGCQFQHFCFINISVHKRLNCKGTSKTYSSSLIHIHGLTKRSTLIVEIFLPDFLTGAENVCEVFKRQTGCKQTASCPFLQREKQVRIESLCLEIICFQSLRVQEGIICCQKLKYCL